MSTKREFNLRDLEIAIIETGADQKNPPPEIFVEITRRGMEFPKVIEGRILGVRVDYPEAPVCQACGGTKQQPPPKLVIEAESIDWRLPSP